MSRPRSPFQVNARCRVVVPSFFLRCGYPLHFEGEVEQVRKYHDADVETFLRLKGVDEDGMDKAVEKVLKAIAYATIRRKGFGGQDRTIHTVEAPELAGAEFTVTRVFFCKTGQYCPARSWYGWEGDRDYDPPVLMDEKTHRVLETSLNCWGDPRLPEWRQHQLHWEIEAANAEFVGG